MAKNVTRKTVARRNRKNIEKGDIDEPEDGKKTKKTKKKNKEEVYPRLNFAISTYYKGTGLEEVLKKLENYLDNADINESDINNI